MLVALVAVLALGAVAASGASAHQWLVNGVEASGQEVSFSGKGPVPFYFGSQVLFSCKGVTGTGTVKAGGLSEAAEVKWTSCVEPSHETCIVKTPGQSNGTVVATSIPVALFETAGGSLADEFMGKGEKEEFIKIEFTGSNCSLGITGKGTMKGNRSALVTNMSEAGDVELAFQYSAVENRGKSLSILGKEVWIESSMTEGLVGGGVLTAS